MFSLALQPALQPALQAMQSGPRPGLAYPLHPSPHLQSCGTPQAPGAAPVAACVPALARDSPIWVSDPALPPAEHGLVVRLTCIRCWVARQACWTPSTPCKTPRSPGSCMLLLSYCAAPRAHYAIRNLPLHSTQAYASSHDSADAALPLGAPLCRRCLPPPAQTRAQLALPHGMVDLDCATLPDMHLLRTGLPGPMHCARLAGEMPPLPAAPHPKPVPS